MIRHLFKLVWNRKRTNLLIVAEIFCSFLVVFALVASGMFLYDRYTQPLGFESDDVWYVTVARNSASDWGQWSAEEAATFRRLLQTLESMDRVVAAAGSNTAPYMGSTHITSWEYEGRKIEPEVSHVTPHFDRVVGLELVAGRWLQDEDHALDWTPIVVDEDLARDLVGDGDPVGKRVSDEDERDRRVVGVVREYRRSGDLEERYPYMFASAGLAGDESRPLQALLIKVTPGTEADFEERLVKTLQSIAHGWSFQVTQLPTARDDYLRHRLIPMSAVAVVAGFLLIMVVLGLTGVMWQNVTRRTREIGLRRATGAHRVRVQRQIVGEVMVTASLGLIIGWLLTIQVPLIGPFAFVPYSVVLPAMLLSSILILILAAICGLYPGWSATRIHPAEALHYE